MAAPIVKKQRKENFSMSETNLLVSEVEINSNLLFAKFDSQIDLKKKGDKWKEITLKLNACGSHQERTSGEVKKKWQDLKKQAKAKESARRKHVRGTGGGPAPRDLTDLEEKIISIIPEVVIDGIFGGIDSAETDAAVWFGSDKVGVDVVDVSESDIDETPEQLVPADVSSVCQEVPTAIKMRDEQKKRRERTEDSFLKVEIDKLEVEKEKVKVLKDIRYSLEELVTLKRQKLLSGCETIRPIIEL